MKKFWGKFKFDNSSISVIIAWCLVAFISWNSHDFERAGDIWQPILMSVMSLASIIIMFLSARINRKIANSEEEITRLREKIAFNCGKMAVKLELLDDAENRTDNNGGKDGI